MCSFPLCQGRHRCFLADVSPCPEYTRAQTLAEFAGKPRRVISRRTSAFVDVDRSDPAAGKSVARSSSRI